MPDLNDMPVFAEEMARDSQLHKDNELLRGEVYRLREEIDKLRWLQTYRLTGHCRDCGGKENAHRMHCRHYVGQLTHKWNASRLNGTFGGVDYDCSCGKSIRVGGMAGTDPKEGDPPPCPNAEQTWRGPIIAAVDALEAGATTGGEGDNA